jgi:hypothetical protein
MVGWGKKAAKWHTKADNMKEEPSFGLGGRLPNSNFALRARGVFRDVLLALKRDFMNQKSR